MKTIELTPGGGNFEEDFLLHIKKEGRI